MNPIKLSINNSSWEWTINEGKIQGSSSLNNNKRVNELAQDMFDLFELKLNPKGFTELTSEKNVNFCFSKNEDSIIYSKIESYLLNHVKKQESLVARAKKCAQINGATTSSNIGKIGITDELGLIEVAKLCAQNNPARTAANICNFGIKNEAALIEIVRICVEKDPRATALNIDKFGIKNEAALIEIVRICAEKDPKATALNIDKFGIKDEQVLIEIAKLCAEKAGGETAANFQRFGIENEEASIEIAELCAQSDAAKTIASMWCFNIKNEEGLIKILKVCVQNDVMETVLNIDRFGIKNQVALVELAKLCAQKGPKETAVAIENFKIKDPEALAEIAMLCAQNDVMAIIQNIGNFGITNQAALIKIAKFCAQMDGERTAECIGNFGITNENALIEIAKLCAESGGWKAAPNIEKFGIKNSKDFVDVIITCFINSNAVPEETLFVFLDTNSHLFKKNSFEEISLPLGEWIEKKFKETDFKELIGGFSKIPDNDLKKEKILLLQTLLFFGDALLSEDQMKWISKEKALQAILSFGRPELRPKIYMNVIEALKNEDYQKNLSQIPSRGNRNPEILIRLLLGKLQCVEGVDEKLINNFFSQCYGRSDSIFYHGKNSQILAEVLLKLLEKPQQVNSSLEKLFSESETFLKKEKEITLSTKQMRSLSGKKAEAQRLLSDNFLQKKIDKKKGAIKKAIDQLEKKESLSEGEKLALAGKKKEVNRLEMLSAEQIREEFTEEREALDKEIAQLERKYSPDQIETSVLKSAQTLLSILLFNDDEWSSQEKSLHEILESLLRNRLSFGKVENFAESYNREFTLSRNPAALTTYVAKLSSLKDERVLPYFAKVLRSVLNGTFKEDRYSLENNPHLTKINEIDPDLLHLWKQDLGPISVDKALKAVDTDDFMAIFLAGEVSGSCQRVDGDPEKNKGLLGYMDGKNRFLGVQDSDERALARCLLRFVFDKDNKPALFRERLYPKSITEEQETTLNALAIRRAEHLGLPLFYQGEKGEDYEGTLKSLQGPMPWEYCDAAEGLQENGIFTIEKSRLLYKGKA